MDDKNRTYHVKKSSLALFGIDSNHIDRFCDIYMPIVGEDIASYRDKIRQIDILQEECAELIQALSKIKRMSDEEYNGDIRGCDEEQFNDKFFSARRNLVEELTHVAISSAVVSRIYRVTQGEINLEVARKDELLLKTEAVGCDYSWECVENLPDTED